MISQKYYLRNKNNMVSVADFIIQTVLSSQLDNNPVYRTHQFDTSKYYSLSYMFIVLRSQIVTSKICKLFSSRTMQGKQIDLRRVKQSETQKRYIAHVLCPQIKN